jgi:molybdate transport system regulatory protein
MRNPSRAAHATREPSGDQNAPEHIITARARTKVWLEHDGRFMIGDGGLHLLQGIVRHGSLAESVREIGWSYRHAWGYLRRAETVLGAALIRTRPGRGAARGMELTPAGRLVLERLHELRARVDEALGPTGPTREDIAARGRRPPSPRRPRAPRAGSR